MLKNTRISGDISKDTRQQKTLELSRRLLLWAGSHRSVKQNTDKELKTGADVALQDNGEDHDSGYEEGYQAGQDDSDSGDSDSDSDE